MGDTVDELFVAPENLEAARKEAETLPALEVGAKHEHQLRAEGFTGVFHYS